ncbi:hypothetical protein H4R35_005326 [Dimargaris xerosporica]|nr:hypothetical protein H4R35_005326 [Dimargaris xerosporica]
MAKQLATRMHPSCSSPAASTHSMAPSNDNHGAPMHLPASIAQLEDQVACLERANADLHVTTPKAVHEAQMAMAQVAYVSALAQFDQAYAALLETQQVCRFNHDQAMARLALRIETTNTLTADRRIEHELMGAYYTGRCAKLAEECDRLKFENKALGEQTLLLSSDVAIQDRHLDVLKRAMRRRQARISGQASE